MRRGRPAVSQGEELRSPQGTPKKRGRPSASQAPEIDEPAKATKEGRRGHFSNTEAEVGEVKKQATEDGSKSKRGRPSASHVEKESRVEKPNGEKAVKKKLSQSSAVADDGEEHRGRRRSRRSDAEREEQARVDLAKEVKRKRGRPSGEVIGVESATSAFGKARGRPPKPNQVAAKSKQKNGEEVSSGPSKISGSVKSNGTKARWASNADALDKRRKSMESKKIKLWIYVF